MLTCLVCAKPCVWPQYLVKSDLVPACNLWIRPSHLPILSISCFCINIHLTSISVNCFSWAFQLVWKQNGGGWYVVPCISCIINFTIFPPFETRSRCVAVAVLELIIVDQLALNSHRFSCLLFLRLKKCPIMPSNLRHFKVWFIAISCICSALQPLSELP